jgi:hypothetical protein
MRMFRSVLTVAALAAVPLVMTVGVANAAGVTTPYEQVGVPGGPCVVTDQTTITLSPTIGVTFGPGSGVYSSCPR